MNGGAYDSVQFQNANHSIRVTDDFMNAAENDGTWTTKARKEGKAVDTYKAKDLLRMIADPPGSAATRACSSTA